MILLQDMPLERRTLFALRMALCRNPLRICELGECCSRKTPDAKYPRMRSLQNRRNKQPGMISLQKKWGVPPVGRTFIAKPAIEARSEARFDHPTRTTKLTVSHESGIFRRNKRLVFRRGGMSFMRPISLAVIVVAVMMLASLGIARPAPGSGPYKILKTAKVGGEGGFDYISSDVENRRLYMPRSGMGHLTVFNLDTLEPVGSIDSIHSGGAAVDPKSHHGFSSTKPITMWDANTLQVIKMIDVDGRPDGIEFDPYNQRVWVLSHQPPYATVIDAKEGTVVGTVDLVGTAEQAASDGKGTVYINISDKGGVAVINAKTLKVTANYDLSAKGVHGSGMAVDAKNHILFAYYRDPKPVVVILNAENGKIITRFSTGEGVDTVAFNPVTMEEISA